MRADFGRPSRSRTLDREAPAYLRIAEELRRRIEDGEYRPHDRLPSQRELSGEFLVTVMTLRQALDLLRRERLIVTRPGLGTFVAPRPFEYSIGPLRSLSQEMSAQGRSVVTRVLGLTTVRADAGAAQALQIPPGSPVLALDRLRIIDGEPSILQRSLLPGDVWRAMDRDALERSSLYELLAVRLRLEVQRATERLYPTVLDAEAARHLSRAPGEPALLSERLSFADRDRAVLQDRAFIPSDRLVIAADRRKNDVSIRYELRSAVGSSADGRAARRPRRGR